MRHRARPNHKRRRRRPPQGRLRRRAAGLAALLALCVVTGSWLSGLPQLKRAGPLLAEARELWPEHWQLFELAEEVERLRSDPRFGLARVEFLGLQRLAASSLTKAAGLIPGEPLIDLDPARVCARLLEQARVAACAAARVPPDRLLVEIAERRPLALLEKSGLAVDAKGERFAPLLDERAALPRLLEVSEQALELARVAQEMGVPLARIEPAGEGELWFWPRAAPLRVRAAGSAESMLAEWLQVERSGLARAHGAREVDLRFRGRAVLRELVARDAKHSNGGERDGPS